MSGTLSNPRGGGVAGPRGRRRRSFSGARAQLLGCELARCAEGDVPSSGRCGARSRARRRRGGRHASVAGRAALAAIRHECAENGDGSQRHAFGAAGRSQSGSIRQNGGRCGRQSRAREVPDQVERWAARMCARMRSSPRPPLPLRRGGGRGGSAADLAAERAEDVGDLVVSGGFDEVLRCEQGEGRAGATGCVGGGTEVGVVLG